MQLCDMVTAPKCKICDTRHWGVEHDWGGGGSVSERAPLSPAHGIDRQIRDIEVGVAKLTADFDYRVVISPARSVDDVRRAEAAVMVARAKKATPKLEVAKEALAAAEAKPKRGRPASKHPDRPWEKEGVTRRTWERRKVREGSP